MEVPLDLRRLPKVELHRHLDGSVRISTIAERLSARGTPLSILELSRTAVLRRPLAGLDAVLSCFATQQAALDGVDTIRRVAFENVEDAWRDGVRLVELRFAPTFIARGKDLGLDDIVAAVMEGALLGMAAYPVQVGLIGILPRRDPADSLDAATRALLRARESGRPGAERLCGFDLADAEDTTDPADFVPYVERARAAGMGITVHSGENTSAAHVARALDVLRPSRIGHGIRAVDDPRVVERLKGEGILLEVCPTSNWITRSVASMDAHPLPRLLHAGVRACVNSDDPNIFGIDLVHEYEACAGMGIERDELEATNRAALAASFLPAALTARVSLEA